MNFTVEGNPKEGFLLISNPDCSTIDYSDYQPREDNEAVFFAIACINEYLNDYFMKNT